MSDSKNNKSRSHGFKLFRSIGRFSVKYRYFVVLFWLVMIPLTNHYFPTINHVEQDTVSDFLPKNSPTSHGTKLESVFLQKNTAANTVIVVSSNSVLDTSDNAAIARIKQNVSQVADITQIRDLGVSSDGEAHELYIGISGAAFGQQLTSIINDIRSAITKAAVPSGVQANLTGDLAAQVDQNSANNKARSKTEYYTVILILVLLFLVFRSVLAPIVTLIPAAFALSIAQPVIAESTKIGVQVGFITQILLIVLLLGAGTDYGLFLVFRVREELRKGLQPKDAVVEALLHVGESITFSAATVIAALLALLLASFGLYKGLGPALAIGLAIMLLIGLTFLPALLAILGRAVFWPTKTTKRDLRIGIWGNLAAKAVKRPIAIMVLGLVIFGVLIAGLSGYKAAGFGSSQPPKGSGSALGEAALIKHFPAANNNPDLLILHFGSSIWNNLGAAYEAQNLLSKSSDFSAISGPFNANGFKLTPSQLYKLHLSNNLLLSTSISQFISNDGHTVQYYAVLKAGPSGSTAAMRAIPAVRSEMASVAKAVGADDNSVYGSDTVAYDINQATNHDLKKIIPVVLVIIAALLALMLRSLVAPWYLILTVGLSYLASLGFAMIVFVHFGHQDGLNFVLPFLMFIFGMALGEDYNILVMSRIREETHYSDDLAHSVTKAIGITGTTVTSAGIILAGTFTILGLVGGNEQVQQIGFGVAFGILLDTFFVRTLLVPSIVSKLGKSNWWPSHLYYRSGK